MEIRNNYLIRPVNILLMHFFRPGLLHALDRGLRITRVSEESSVILPASYTATLAVTLMLSRLNPP